MLSISLCLLGLLAARAVASDPTAPFETDEHTLLLYHFDEGEGPCAKDSSGHGYDGQIQGAQWSAGRFGSALRFDGVDDCVFRETTEAIRGLKQLTVECWFRQDNPTGRQFLVGHDITFHVDLSEGSSTSISLYHEGASVANAQGLRHQQIGAGLGTVRLNRWHHLAVTFDGHRVSFLLDGNLVARNAGGDEFLLGVPSRGLWVGCYVGNDFWFHGQIDEVRVSSCVRYDSAHQLAVGQKAFELPAKPARQKAVRQPQVTGTTELSLRVKRLYGGDSAGWISLKPPNKPAVIVGRFDLHGIADQAEHVVTLDVSDEWCGDGLYIVGVEPIGSGYCSVVSARLVRGDSTVAGWTGDIPSRHTFDPPILLPLPVGAPTELEQPGRILLLPDAADRVTGDLDIGSDDPHDPPCVFGDGQIEYWTHVPRMQAYRVYLRYASPNSRPCDLVIDGGDLHPYHMAARNTCLGPSLSDALWEYQGTTSLAAGLHWIRLQDVLPEIVALRLEPVEPLAPAAIPWQRYAVPADDLLTRATSWHVRPLFGRTSEATCICDESGTPTLKFAAAFTNTDRSELFAGDCVRLVHTGTWDLEPFGRLRFRLTGQGSGHVVSLWAVDAKHDEKLLWRMRDINAGTQDISVPISFEGNDVFDPGHVTAICLELDEGNSRADQPNRIAGAMINPVFDRRDVVVPSPTHAHDLAAARQAIGNILEHTRPRAAPQLTGRFRPWTTPVVPEEHPLFEASDPKPVTRRTLGYELHCTGARDIGSIALDQFHSFYDFGDVCWPHIGICPQRNAFSSDEAYRTALQEMEKRLQDVRDRGLYLFDIWGYVPFDSQYPSKFAPEHHEILMRIFGDRFLGYDNGEQDGRYIGGYADRDPHTNRREGWENFVNWDKHICDDSMNYMNATGSLNFSHYYGDRDCRTLGLETAQGLPSDTLMFAFLRGAGKQYGRLLTQATSIWNRFGYNMYHGRKTEGSNGYGYGPNKGCSLSLHKRLFLSSYLGGHSIVGSETSQFTADTLPHGAPELSPLGKQHLELREWFRQHPDRGVQYTPVAFMLDFYNGWNMPRHLYRGDKYKIWGKLPYEKGDYLIDGMFRMIWPGYEDCSYLRNERGFLTPTPYGDIFDVITNRCHPSILAQYHTVVLLGDVELTPDIVVNLVSYVRDGGDLVIDARNARALPEAITGIQLREQAKACLSCLPRTGTQFDEQPYTYTVGTPLSASSLLVNEHGHPLVTVNRVEQGRVVVGTVDYWMTDPLVYSLSEIVHMEPPYRMLQGVRAVFGEYFESFSPVELSPAGLGITTCCFDLDPKRLLIGLMNNELCADWKGTFSLRIGEVAAVHELRSGRELAVDQLRSLEVAAGDVVILDIRLR